MEATNTTHDLGDGWTLTELGDGYVEIAGHGTAILANADLQIVETVYANDPKTGELAIPSNAVIEAAYSWKEQQS